MSNPFLSTKLLRVSQYSSCMRRNSTVCRLDVSVNQIQAVEVLYAVCNLSHYVPDLFCFGSLRDGLCYERNRQILWHTFVRMLYVIFKVQIAQFHVNEVIRWIFKLAKPKYCNDVALLHSAAESLNRLLLAFYGLLRVE